MQTYTTPVTYPKPAVPSRVDALEDGQLIDLAELTDVPSLPLECALSEELLDAVEQIAFADLGRTDTQTRLESVIAGAASALLRAEQHFGAAFPSALHYGFILDFSSPLRTRSEGSSYRFVRMHCGPDEMGEVVMTLMLPDAI